jgi:tetratricopeptide (TPR) repeat protein
MEFDTVFQDFIRRFRSTLGGILSIMGLAKESISLDNAGIKDYLIELKELPCRRLSGLSAGAIYLTRSKGSSDYISALLKKYEGIALSRESCSGVIESINKVAGYSEYFSLMDSQKKLVEAKPVLLAISEIQQYHDNEPDKRDMLSALSMLLFNIFPTPKLLKFVAKFEPDPGNDLLSFDHSSLLALNYTLLGRLKEAAIYNERAFNFAADENRRAYTHMLGSCICISRHQYDEAINMLHRCISLTKDRRISAVSQFYMGIIHYELDQIDDAIWCFKRARVGIDDEIDLMSVCNDLGTCAMVKGELRSAVRAFEQVGEISRVMGSQTAKLLTSVAYGNLGIVHMSMLDYLRALEYFKKALILNRETHNKIGVANQLGNIGLALKRRLDFSSSLEYFKSALNFSYSIEYADGVSFAYGQVEQLMALQGSFDDAEAYRQEVIRRNPGISKMLKKEFKG